MECSNWSLQKMIGGRQNLDGFDDFKWDPWGEYACYMFYVQVFS